MRSSAVLSAALLATGAVAAPIAYGTVNDQDISIRDNIAEASHYGITDEPDTLDRRPKIPIVHNPIPPKLPGPQPAQPHKTPAEKGGKTPKIKPEDLARRQKIPFVHNPLPPKIPGPQPAQPHKIPVEKGDKTPKIKPEDLERRQTNTILHNAIQAAKVGKNHIQHQIKQEMKLPAQSNIQLPKFPGPAPVPELPAYHKNPLEGWHTRRDAQPENDMSEGTLE